MPHLDLTDGRITATRVPGASEPMLLLDDRPLAHPASVRRVALYAVQRLWEAGIDPETVRDSLQLEAAATCGPDGNPWSVAPRLVWAAAT